MSRLKLSAKIKTEIAYRSQRICCLCFGLDNKPEPISKGQFAHIDRMAHHNSPENIAFLCLNHHAEYDGRMRQAASITPGEVRKYRSDLYKFVRNRRRTFATLKKTVVGAVDYWAFKEGPTKLEIDTALELFAGPHRPRSILIELDKKARTLTEIQQTVPGEAEWVESIANGLVKSGLAFGPSGKIANYRIAPAGVRLLRILDSIPDFIKDAAWKANWQPDHP